MQADQSNDAWRRLFGIALVAVATLLALAVVSEGAARLLFHESSTSTMACLIADDPRTGVRGIPGSFCQQKIFESPLVDYHFNDCGFRTPQPCRAAPPGTYRIVLLGSSLAYGMHVAQPSSLAGQLGPLLSARTGRPVDVFNEAMQWGFPASVALRTGAMLLPKGDMILWTLTPFDIENTTTILPNIPGKQDALTIGAPPAGSSPTAAKGPLSIPGRIWRRIIAELSRTQTIFMLQHYLYRSQSQFLSHTLAQGHQVDYLRVPTPPELQDNLVIFRRSFVQVAATARAAHVPLVVTLLPSRSQAIMISNRSWENGYDPHQLDRLLRRIVEDEGGTYVDMTTGLEKMPGAGQLYFSVDEHLPPEGHKMLADLLADALTRSGTMPASKAVEKR